LVLPDHPHAHRTEVSGAWTLEDDTIVVTRNAAGEPERRMRVVPAAPDRLVVARD